MNDFAKVKHAFGRMDGVLFGIMNRRRKVKERAEKPAETLVKVEEVFGFLLVKRAEVVGIIFKEGAGAISGDNGIPMEMLPIAMVGNSDVAGEAFQRSRFADGDGEGL
jgi:hypothetical protein